PHIAIVELALALVVTLSGCTKSQSPPEGAEVGGTGAMNQPPTPPKLNEEDCRNFAADWEKAVNGRNVRALNDLIDWDTLTGPGLAELDLPEGLRKRSVESAKNSTVAQFVGAVAKGDTYKFLRLHVKDGRQYALFRLVGESGGPNYHDVL